MAEQTITLNPGDTLTINVAAAPAADPVVEVKTETASGQEEVFKPE